MDAGHGLHVDGEAWLVCLLPFCATNYNKTLCTSLSHHPVPHRPQFVLFLPCAAAYYQLTDPNSPNNIHWFQFLYFFSSFWGQFGPNATTWLLPAELVPTETRAMCHGIAAATGKAGALVSGVIFGLRPTCTAGLAAAMAANGSTGSCLISGSGAGAAKQSSLLSQAANQRNFYISAFCGLAGEL